MTTSQTKISFAVLFMITRSSTVRFMVEALDKTVLMLGMPQERACSSTLILSAAKMGTFQGEWALLEPE
jgi:hypothetical protein